MSRGTDVHHTPAASPPYSQLRQGSTKQWYTKTDQVTPWTFEIPPWPWSLTVSWKWMSRQQV